MATTRQLIVFALLCVTSLTQTQTANDAIDPSGCSGPLLIGGGGSLPDSVYDHFLELAGGKQASIVLVPTASSRADTAEGRQQILARWQQDYPGISFSVLHTRDRTEADTSAFCAPLTIATGVWFGGGSQQRIADAYIGTRFERELYTLHQRGGAIGGSSAGAAIQSRTMIARGKSPPEISTGFDLVPHAIVDQHFLKRKRLPRLITALEQRPGLFGLGIDEQTAAVIRGRELYALGKSEVLLVLGARNGKPQRIQRLKEGDLHTDIVIWQRAARQRATGPWPLTEMPAPVVKKGTVMLGGGGQLPRAVFEHFIACAGGKEARILFAPTASPRIVNERKNRTMAMFRQLGAKEVMLLAPRHPSEVTDEHIAMSNRATGVWFGGGRQWRTVDAFDNTPMVAALHRVLARGGVIGGSSAGASIQGELLVRGNPMRVIQGTDGQLYPGNTDMWCEGYDRGFAFLPGCAVDQHFLVRKRLSDLQGVIEQCPQIIGIGVDEGTCAVVSGSTLKVLGTSQVAVLDARSSSARPIAPTLLKPGQSWDLLQARLIRD